MKKQLRRTFLVSLLLTIIVSFSNAQWTQIAQDIDGTNIEDRFGYSLSTNAYGNIVAVGAIQNNDPPGYARVFEFISNSWIQLGDDILGEAAHDWFGYSIDLNSLGDIVAIGGFQNDGNGESAGHVRVFKFQDGEWIQLGDDIDGDYHDQSGNSVSLNSDGNKVAIGSFSNSTNGHQSGLVKIFEFENGNWLQVGAPIYGEVEDDRSGASVRLNATGNIVAIGAFKNSGNGVEAGHVRIFENIEDNWIQIGQDIDGEATGDQSGYSLSMDSTGNIIAIGSRYNDGNGDLSGHTRVFENIDDYWYQMGENILGEAAGDQSGFRISLNSEGNILAIGAKNNSNINGGNAGHVRVFEYSGNNWVQIGSDINGENAMDGSGFSVSLNSDGSRVVIGAPWNDDNVDMAGHVRVYEYQSTSIDENNTSRKLIVFPNPTTGIIRIQAKNVKFIEITNQFGNSVFKDDLNSDLLVLNLSHLAKGTYVIKAITSKQTFYEKLIIK